MKVFKLLILVLILCWPGLCFAGDVKRGTVTIFDYSSATYRSYEIETQGNVTEIFSWQNANTVRIEQTSPGDFEVFDYGGRGLGEFNFIEDIDE